MKIVSNLFSKNCRRKKSSKEVRIESYVLISKNRNKGAILSHTFCNTKLRKDGPLLGIIPHLLQFYPKNG
jgi:hypothetical protein